MNSTAEKLREAAAYIKDCGIASVFAIARVRDALGVGKTDAISRDLGAVLDTIADELDELQARAAGANNLRQQLESAEKKAERRRQHIGCLETALHDKNALLEQRGGTIARLTAECSELRKQVPSERERQILDMWPRFENGEYVWFGDRYEDWDGWKKEVAAVQFERNESSLLDCDGFHTCFSLSERVKRPAPKVLDADGVEIKVGDRIYSIENGNSYTVRSINGSGTIEFKGFDDKGWFPKYFTHMQPAIDADGVLIKVGDAVWFRSLSTGDRMRKATVTGFGEHSLDGPLATLKDEAGRTWHIDPKKVTHVQPDSWERFVEDMQKSACAYFGYLHKECDEGDGCPARGALDCGIRKMDDLIRRAKALAGVEVSE